MVREIFLTTATACCLLIVPLATPLASPLEQGPCAGPLGYEIGGLDERFGLTRAQLRAALGDAEAIWEHALGRDLFVEDPNGPIDISLVYDDRQRTREYLARNDKTQEAIQQNFDRLAQQLEAEQKRYERTRASLDQRMRRHNQTVAYWNQRGGAPPAEYRKIQTTAGHLRRERDDLARQTRSINRLGKQVKDLADRHKRAAMSYIRGVEALNQRYTHEVSIGDFAANRIRIFSFDNPRHLRLLLAHELGHALGLGHVEDPEAIMHYIIRPSSAEIEVTDADRAEFARACGP